MSNFFVNWLNNFGNHKGELVGGGVTMMILLLKAKRSSGDKDLL